MMSVCELMYLIMLSYRCVVQLKKMQLTAFLLPGWLLLYDREGLADGWELAKTKLRREIGLKEKKPFKQKYSKPVQAGLILLPF